MEATETTPAAANPITRRTVIGWAYTTAPASMGYGTDDERAEADRKFADSEPDAVGTVATLPGRIAEAMRRAGLDGGVYYRQELRLREGRDWRAATRDEIDALDALAEGLIVSPFAGKRQGG
jgi:hypothetical protein